MEFSYKVTEEEFKAAWRLKRKASSRSSFKTAVFWILLMLGLLMFYRSLEIKNNQPEITVGKLATQSIFVNTANFTPPSQESIADAGPFIVLSGVWTLIVSVLIPMRLRLLYQRDPRMQGQFTVNVTKDYVTTENSAGTESKTSWNVYNYWCENKGIIVLMFHSGAYSILSLAMLSGAQKKELREILSASLKRK